MLWPIFWPSRWALRSLRPWPRVCGGLLDYVSGIEEEFDDDTVRPGIVHRLDKDTSGVIIIAKNPRTHEFLSRQFRDKVTRKTYIAIVRGRLPKKHDIIDTYLARDRQNRKKFTVPSGPKGKQAITEYQVEKEFGNYTFLNLYPHTGRTHQLRGPVRRPGVWCQKSLFFP